MDDRIRFRLAYRLTGYRVKMGEPRRPAKFNDAKRREERTFPHPLLLLNEAERYTHFPFSSTA